MYHFNLGNALHDLGQLDSAMAEYRTAIDFDPKHAHAHANLGNALVSQGQLEEAIRELQTAVEINPNHAIAKAQLARVQPLVAARHNSRCTWPATISQPRIPSDCFWFRGV